MFLNGHCENSGVPFLTKGSFPKGTNLHCLSPPKAFGGRVCKFERTSLRRVRIFAQEVKGHPIKKYYIIPKLWMLLKQHD